MAQKDTNKKSKNKVVTSAIAAALALVMLIGGGSYAYLQDTSDDVANNFDTNKVTVDIKETTGSEYNIIPGTSEDKDPVISVDNTVDSYLYAIVTDNTDGLVTYDIADGWTPLDGYTDGNTKVYYREVAKDADTKEFSVLKDNKVSYASTIENKDMLKEDSKTLKDGLALTFEGYTIQKDGFATAADGFAQQYTKASTSSDAKSAIAEGKSVIATKDLTLSRAEMATSEGADLNLSGNNLTIEKEGNINNYAKFENTDVTISNGTVKAEDVGWSYCVFEAGENSTLTLDNVNADLGYSAGIGPVSGADDVTINIKNSTVKTTGYYVLATNGSNVSDNLVMNVENSTLEETSKGGVAVLLNVPGILNIKDSVITGTRSGIIVRGGTANISNTTINCESNDPDDAIDKWEDSDWGSGGQTPGAALVVGDRNSAYQYDAAANLSNVTFNYGDKTGRKPVYAAAQKDAGGNHTTTIKGISADKVTVYQGDGGTVTVTE